MWTWRSALEAQAAAVMARWKRTRGLGRMCQDVISQQAGLRRIEQSLCHRLNQGCAVMSGRRLCLGADARGSFGRGRSGWPACLPRSGSQGAAQNAAVFREQTCGGASGMSHQRVQRARLVATPRTCKAAQRFLQRQSPRGSAGGSRTGAAMLGGSLPPAALRAAG